jgi:hypothetical protein
MINKSKPFGPLIPAAAIYEIQFFKGSCLEIRYLSITKGEDTYVICNHTLDKLVSDMNQFPDCTGLQLSQYYLCLLTISMVDIRDMHDISGNPHCKKTVARQLHCSDPDPGPSLRNKQSD